MDTFKQLVAKGLEKISMEVKTKDNIDYINCNILKPIFDHMLTGKFRFLKYVHIYFFVILILLCVMFLFAILQIILLILK